MFILFIFIFIFIDNARRQTSEWRRRRRSLHNRKGVTSDAVVNVYIRTWTCKACSLHTASVDSRQLHTASLIITLYTHSSREIIRHASPCCLWRLLVLERTAESVVNRRQVVHAHSAADDTVAVHYALHNNKTQITNLTTGSLTYLLTYW